MPLNILNRIKSNPNSIYSILLFVGLFIYLILRAIFNEPLHDEIACFYNYIELGGIYGPGVIQDAQNHFLNSYLERFCFLLFGDNFFFLRLPNLLAFPFYFLGLYRLSKSIHPPFQFIVLAGLSCIPFILEYFAYARGYGISLTFFIWMLLFLHNHLKNPSLKNFIKVLIPAYFTLFSNLIYFNSILICLGLLFFIQCFSWKQFSIKEHIIKLLLYGIFLISIFPFFYQGLVLRNGGALYYGSLDGFWEVTGHSLTYLVFFISEDYPKYIFIALFLLLLYYIFKDFFQLKWKMLFQKKYVLFALFLIGNCFAILILANAMQVNYPEDRVGMYLIPLFLFTFIFIAQHRFQKSLYLLLFFPLSFLSTMSLHNSVFSNDNRMKETFYNRVKKEISASDAVAVHPLMHLSWPWLERNSSHNKHHVATSYNFDKRYDVIITRKKLIPLSSELNDFVVINQDEENGYIALRNKKKQSNPEIIEIPAFHADQLKGDTLIIKQESLSNKHTIDLLLKGKYSNTNTKKEIVLVLEVFSNKHELVWRDLFPCRWYFGQPKSKQFVEARFYVPSLPNHSSYYKIYWLRK
jgi:hypothetical protein